MLRVFMFIMDILITACAFLLAYWLRQDILTLWLRKIMAFPHYARLLLVVLPAWALFLYYFGAYKQFRTDPYLADIKKLFKASLSGMVLFVTVLFIFDIEHVSRVFMVVFFLLQLTLLALFHLAIRLAASAVRKRNLNRRSVLIAGTGQDARALARTIEDHRGWGLKLLGFISCNEQDDIGAQDDITILGGIDDLDLVIQENVVDEILIAVSQERLPELQNIFTRCEEAGIDTRVVVNFFPMLSSRVHMEYLHGIPLLSFTTTPQNQVHLAFKRVFDIFVSAFLLAALSPLLVLAAVLIKATSPGPVFFRQERVGLNGRKFHLLKFRSMVAAAETMRDELVHLNEADGPVFKIRKDPRITAVGRWLRKSSLDEFPQFINVLKGDMSIVGPRPPIQDEVELYDRWQRRRLSMKPGITCLWQISGRSHVSFDQWVAMDLDYIDNWSLGLDMKIFIKTIPVVLFGRGAY
jgi:exopolysaccharide biosynthesis polyprenyl glycosylphosphotransferase